VCSLQTTGHMQGKLDWSRAMALWPLPPDGTQDDCNGCSYGCTACGFLLRVWVRWSRQNGVKWSCVIVTA
jgi:hypothetical protein